MVPDDLGRNRLVEALAKIGFEPTKSRYFKHPECAQLFLEFPRGPVEIGEEHPVIPAEIEVEGRKLRLLSPTDSVKDHLAGYIHWKSSANFDQALLIFRSFMLVARKSAKSAVLKILETEREPRINTDGHGL